MARVGRYIDFAEAKKNQLVISLLGVRALCGIVGVDGVGDEVMLMTEGEST